MFEELLENLCRVNEVNIQARLAADDLLSSFSEAYEEWEKVYKEQLGIKDLKLAQKMVTTALRQGFYDMLRKFK